MANKTFTKQFLLDILDEDIGDVKVSEKSISSGRWEERIRTVFRHEDKHYALFWQRGLTEDQYFEPLEFEQDEISCPEVKAVEVIVTEWEEVDNG